MKHSADSKMGEGMKVSDRKVDNPSDKGRLEGSGNTTVPPSLDVGLAIPKTRPSTLKIVFVLAIGATMIAGVVALLLLNNGENDDTPQEEIKTGILIVTLINTFHMGSSPVDYELYLNGQLASNGTIPAADSAVIEMSFNWTGTELTVLIQVIIADTSDQPDDRSVILIPGETERVNILLGI